MASSKKQSHFAHKEEVQFGQEGVEEVQIEYKERQEKEEPPGQEVKMEDLQSEVEKLRQIAEEHKKKAEENYELFLRARADVENTRRRSKNEKEKALKYAYVPLLESLLPVLDNFERALQAVSESNEETLKEGIEMVYRHFMQVLSEAGLSVIEAEGKEFDPHYHNAVMQVEAEGVEPGIVVEELQTGYCYLDRVIRPTMVKVSK